MSHFVCGSQTVSPQKEKKIHVREERGGWEGVRDSSNITTSPKPAEKEILQHSGWVHGRQLGAERASGARSCVAVTLLKPGRATGHRLVTARLM